MFKSGKFGVAEVCPAGLQLDDELPNPADHLFWRPPRKHKRVTVLQDVGSIGQVCDGESGREHRIVHFGKPVPERCLRPDTSSSEVAVDNSKVFLRGPRHSANDDVHVGFQSTMQSAPCDPLSEEEVRNHRRPVTGHEPQFFIKVSFYSWHAPAAGGQPVIGCALHWPLPPLAATCLFRQVPRWIPTETQCQSTMSHRRSAHPQCEEEGLKCNPSSSSSDVLIAAEEIVEGLGGWRACLPTPSGNINTHNQRSTSAT